MTESHAGTDSSALVRELRLLLEALVDRGGPWLDRVAGEGPGHDGPAEPAACRWCPLCAALALARGERSELAALASEQVAGLVTVLREFVESGEVPRHGFAEHEPGRSPSPRVQRIPVRGAEPPPGPDAGGHRQAPEPEPEAPPGRVQHIAVRRRPPGDRESGR